MKKSLLLGMAMVLGMSATAVAQEVTYEPDCSQGLLIGKATDNWFISAQGGGNYLFGEEDCRGPVKDRICGGAGLFVGKWVTPAFGVRFGATYNMYKGASFRDGLFRNYKHGEFDGYPGIYQAKSQAWGPEFDVMLNLCNWWGGYKPNRVYNAVVHGGFGGNLWYARKNNAPDYSWEYQMANMNANIGLQNNFRVAEHLDLYVDVEYKLLDFSLVKNSASASVGLTYYFDKKGFDCPTTAVCPTWKYTDAEGDALVARLSSAENQIVNLQSQLDAALRRPVQTVKVNPGIATIYYPIAKSNLSTREKTILRAVANVMKESGKKYVITGFADNYTGTDAINAKLRNARVETVKKFLVNCGVAADQLDVRVDDNNLTDFGSKAAPLDRAVTIKVAE